MNTASTHRSPPTGASDPVGTGGPEGPRPHTDAELASLMALLLRDPDARVETVTVGRSRDAASRASADAFADAWQAQGGTVLAVVDWPETAASWLRPATRLTAGPPDAWVVAAALPGFVRLARRLRHSTGWDPARTYAFASLQDSRLPTLAGPDTVHGLRGATAAGGTWDVRHRWATSYEAAVSVS
ncbi:ABC transporter substrate-binding protein [Streptomyces sp. NPDC057428]|uniref:ABC transporter substrate-binding protein n=1 Tax=Streptomyces sp. NPDC057428 TaxID=3346129 RepID=UPI00369C41A0